jgi:hypothetical protein
LDSYIPEMALSGKFVNRAFMTSYFRKKEHTMNMYNYRNNFDNQCLSINVVL